MKKGTRAIKTFLISILPIFIVFQFYYWNLDFNDYVKSFIFPSKVYECKYLKELRGITIPLPERTVLKGRSDGCSPFYSTYINDKGFINFYNDKLKTMKTSGEIEEYSLLELNDDDHRVDKMGYEIQLSSNLKIYIFIYRFKDTDKWHIAIDNKKW